MSGYDLASRYRALTAHLRRGAPADAPSGHYVRDSREIVCPSEEMHHATCTVMGYWWSPPDGEQYTHPNGFVGVLPPPAMYAERLALTLGGVK